MSKTSREIRLGQDAFHRSNAELLRILGRETPFARAYVGGVFDLPHRGHLALLSRVRRLAESTVLSLNTDEFTERYKRKPVMPLADRMAIWSTCRLVDDVIVNFGDHDSRPAILASRADCIVHADDWQGSSLASQMGFDDDWLTEFGLSVVILPYTPFVSTTQLVDAHKGTKTPAQIAMTKR